MLIPPITWSISNWICAGISALKTKATELWEAIVLLETEKYDLEERSKRQDYDVSSLPFDSHIIIHFRKKERKRKTKKEKKKISKNLTTIQQAIAFSKAKFSYC